MREKKLNLNRRQFLRRTAAGAGAVTVAGVTGANFANVAKASGPDEHPLIARPPHFAPRAKRVIMLFMTGGVSHVDTFDPKPKLREDHNKDAGRDRFFIASQFRHKPYGQSGIEVTDLFPHVGEQIDDICLIRSMVADHGDHFHATLGMHTGSTNFALPGIGSWVSYGLGTLNINLPSHVVFARHLPYAGAQVYDSNFLPAYHQGTRIKPGKTPIAHIDCPIDEHMQASEMALLRKMNEQHLASRQGDNQLIGRMESYATAQGLQQQAPHIFDLNSEDDKTLDLYGVKKNDNRSFAWQCLMARRLAERGVRFIELIDTGASGNWDSHGNMKAHGSLARNVDQPIAGLIADLKQRGLFEDTLIVWCTEFGRTPWEKQRDHKGRSHHRSAFTCWLAGAGTRGGYVYGRTDDHGGQVTENPVSIHDFHATILHYLGLDHTKLTFHHGGRDYRLTDVHGNVVHDVMG